MLKRTIVSDLSTNELVKVSVVNGLKKYKLSSDIYG